MKKILIIVFGMLLIPSLLSAQVPDPCPKLTRWVDKAPRALEDDLPALCEHLIRPCETDTQKAWVIYRWISRNIAYDDEARKRDKGRINRNIRDILQRQKALCFGYAQLFQRMAEEVGLEAVRISGYSKGTLTAQPEMDVADHAWNAVRLDGDWALLDVTWGSSLIQGSNDFVQAYREGYFLTTPEKFVLTHLPLQPMWQLLDCPLQATEFNQAPETILHILAERPNCFTFQDSIRAFLALPTAEQPLVAAQTAYSFNPTPGNAEELGHALVDYAGRLSDQADSQAEPGSEIFLTLQEKAIDAFNQADELVVFFDWQKELYADLLINQTVTLYNQSAELSETGALRNRYQQLLRYLEIASAQLSSLENSLLAGRKIQACKSYAAAIREELAQLKE